ncbi:Eco57I restriction-modification methylase domain-containing protein, partial [Salmonella sp. SAL04181]|uniref:Eco57I restriction-modification methylase domain-containing protein n=1 Tax=Salmonella sp. SAL04181 TaxID=3159801 RepID=UPI0039784F15
PNEQFSAIIGNPPYIRWKHLDVELQQELKNHKLWGVLFNPLSDYLSVFIANAIEHLREGGQLIFITPSFWMHTLHAHPLRQW